MKQEIEQKELGMGNFQGYPSLLRQIKHRVSFAQQKAMYAANEELLRMNWDIGEMLTKSQEIDGWGKKTLQRLAVDLKNEYPERKGFSVRNMQCMMQFYNEYNKELTMAKVGHFSIAQPLVAQLKNNVNTLPIKQYNDHKLASNIERFPNDFRFELSKEECLRSQFVTSNGRGGNRYSTTVLTLLDKRNLEQTLLQSKSRLFFFISMISLLFPSYSIKNTKKLWWFQLFSVSLQTL